MTGSHKAFSEVYRHPKLTILTWLLSSQRINRLSKNTAGPTAKGTKTSEAEHDGRSDPSTDAALTTGLLFGFVALGHRHFCSKRKEVCVWSRCGVMLKGTMRGNE